MIHINAQVSFHVNSWYDEFATVLWFESAMIYYVVEIRSFLRYLNESAELLLIIYNSKAIHESMIPCEWYSDDHSW
jgi:hypothetical protein